VAKCKFESCVMAAHILRRYHAPAHCDNRQNCPGYRVIDKMRRYRSFAPIGPSVTALPGGLLALIKSAGERTA
jgi:hypothetical protein